jgi:hypothetical protein
MSYVVNRLEGVPISVQKVGDASVIPLDEDNRDFRDFLTWNAAQPTPLDYTTVQPWKTPRIQRRLADIAADIAALPQAQKDKLHHAILAVFLQQVPRFAKDLGIAVDGDQANL